MPPEILNRSHCFSPDNVRGLSNLGTTYVSQGRYTDAINVLKRLIAIRPEASAYTDLGNAYFYLREFDQATPPMRKRSNWSLLRLRCGGI